MNHDMHPTVTKLREALATPDAFRAWLAQQGGVQFGYSNEAYRNTFATPWGARLGGQENCTPLAAYLHQVLLIGKTDRTLSDTTHCYWWLEGCAYSLMLPEWARAFQRAIGPSLIKGEAALAKLDEAVEVMV